jgi:hypothetical protein
MAQSTIVITASEDPSGAGNDAQFTVSVDGNPVGGTDTVTAYHAQGQTEQFTVTGDFGASGPSQVAVNFLDSSPNPQPDLYIESVDVNTVVVPGNQGTVTPSSADPNPSVDPNAAVLFEAGTATFNTAGSPPTPPTVTATNQTVGSGQAIALSQVFSANDPDGDLINSFQLTLAGSGGNAAIGEIVDGNGNTINASQPITVTSLAGLSYVGSSVSAGTDVISLAASDDSGADFGPTGQATMTDTGGSPSPSPQSTIVITASEDPSGAGNDAQFTVSVDGNPVGGTDTVTAYHAQGQTEQFTVTGDFGASGPSQVAVNFLDSSPNPQPDLYIESVDVNNVVVPGNEGTVTPSSADPNPSVDPNAAVLFEAGTATFDTAGSPPTPTGSSGNSGSGSGSTDNNGSSSGSGGSSLPTLSAIPFVPFAAGTATTSFDSSWNLVGSGDFSGDGTQDLVYQRASDGLVEIQLLDGNAVVGGGAISNNAFGAGWNLVDANDFTGNGKTDLVWQRASDGLVEIQYMDGTTAAGGGAIADNPFGAGWGVVGSGDFNNDGKADLILRRNTDGLTEIQYLNGTTPIGGGAIANNAFGAGWNIVASGVDNGNSDLVWRRASDGLTEIQELNGTTVVGGGAITNNAFGAGWNVVGSGDFTGSGNTDLVWQRSSDGMIEIQLLKGATVVGGGALAGDPLDGSWKLVGTADLNNSGKTDLIFRQNTPASPTAVLEMNGNTVVSEALIGNPSSTQLAQLAQAMAGHAVGPGLSSSASTFTSVNSEPGVTLAFHH